MNEENKDSKLPVASSVGIATAAVLIGNLGESIERNRLLQAISDSRSSETRDAAIAALAAFDKKSNDMLALEMGFYKLVFSALLVGIAGVVFALAMIALFELF